MPQVDNCLAFVLWVHCRSFLCHGTHSKLEVSQFSQQMDGSSVRKCGLCCIHNFKSLPNIVVGGYKMLWVVIYFEKMSQYTFLQGREGGRQVLFLMAFAKFDTSLFRIFI